MTIRRCPRYECDSLLKAVLKSSDIISGRVHLDVSWIDQYQPTQWIVANVAHLSIIHLLGGPAPSVKILLSFGKEPCNKRDTV